MIARRSMMAGLLLGGLLLAACQGAAPAPSQPPTAAAGATPLVGNTGATPAAAGATPVVKNTGTAPAAAGEVSCVNGGAIAANAGEPLAAKVNGQAIPLAIFERQAAQNQAALIAQGVDPNSADGQEALQAIRAQALATLIDNILIEQAAAAQNVKLANKEVDTRLKAFVSEAGGAEKFNQYLTQNQLTRQDLCMTIRASALGEMMLERVTAKLPTKVEQVRVAHILFDTKADAERALPSLQGSADFAALAQQLSRDEATRDNGGELGWIPRGVMAPEFEQAAFALQPGQISGVVQSQLGFHILKVLAREAARALSPELAQNQRQGAFIVWLEEQRGNAKIEKLINP